MVCSSSKNLSSLHALYFGLWFVAPEAPCWVRLLSTLRGWGNIPGGQPWPPAT
jgi:hypothetical protein